MYDAPVMENARIHYDAEAFDMGETRYVHENGNSMEFAGSQEEGGGEWFATNAAGELIDQGFYEDWDDVTVIFDSEDNEIGEFDQAQMFEWMDSVLSK